MKHAPGTFCWAELATSDPSAAKSFYTQLFGWDTHDDPIPSGGVYTMLQLDGGNAGALYQMHEEMQEAGIPPHWGSYISVDDIDATVARAKALGAEVAAEPFDVMEAGRMAVIKDPGGAVISFWQPKQHGGFHLADGRPGSVCWNELFTNDPDKAGPFYTELLGWTANKIPEMDYTMFNRGDKEVGGMIKIRPDMQGAVPNWMIYVAVASCDDATAKAKALGAKCHVEPRDIPGIGRFSVLADPQGAGFALWEQKGTR